MVIDYWFFHSKFKFNKIITSFNNKQNNEQKKIILTQKNKINQFKDKHKSNLNFNNSIIFIRSLIFPLDRSRVWNTTEKETFYSQDQKQISLLFGLLTMENVLELIKDIMELSGLWMLIVKKKKNRLIEFNLKLIGFNYLIFDWF